MDSKQEIILNEIRKERRRQDEKWGIQRHPQSVWMAILMEEVGEACKAFLESNLDSDYRRELIQVAAVAVAAIESFDY